MKNAIKVSKRTRNLLAYVIGTVIVVLGTILLVALATGWQYDFSTGELRDTGLILMGSEPSGADITVNGTPLKQQTPYRYANVLPGEYEVSFTKDGYRPWVRRTTVDAERVSFNDFAWLLPTTVPQRDRFASRTITDITQSVDRRRMVFVEQPKTVEGQPTPAPILTTTTDWARDPVTLYAPTVAPVNPTTPDPTQVARFDQLSLSADGGNMIVRQTLVSGTSQYLILPTSPSENFRTTNLSTETAQTFEWLEWAPTGNNDLWVKSQGVISRWLVSERRLEPTGLKGISYADWSQDKLITISPDGDTKPQLQVREKDSLDSPISIATVAASPAYKTEYFRGIDHDYLAVLPQTTGQLMLARDIYINRENLIVSQLGQDITNFTINRSGRHLVMVENDQLVSLDLENLRRSRWQASLKGLGKWEWMNDQHLAMEVEGQLRVVDYDGQNNQLIAESIKPGTPLVFGENKSVLGLKLPTDSATGPAILQHYFLNPEKILE